LSRAAVAFMEIAGKVEHASSAAAAAQTVG
jgi:hypothetical protein